MTALHIGGNVSTTLKPPDSQIDRSPSLRFHHEREIAPYAQFGIARNQLDLAIALTAVPRSLDEDVENHIAHIAPALGMSRTKALQYIDIGLQLPRLPKLLRLATSHGHIPFAHLRTIATAIGPIHNPELLAEIDEELAAFATPRVDGEVLRGVQSLNRLMQKLIEPCEPMLRPRDLPGQDQNREAADTDTNTGTDTDTEADPMADTADNVAAAADVEKLGERINFVEGTTATDVYMTLDKVRAFEFRTVLKSISNKLGCTLVEAFSHLIHGTADFSVNLNLYCPLTEEKPAKAWLGGHGWITGIATENWLNRVTGIRIMADETVDGYTPSERQRAYVQGRDGACSYPGCTVDATKCDIDHIEPYNHENPEDGGSTATQNLHCLCRRHHNMKTAGLWEISRQADGTEIWQSNLSGTKLISTESGPMAGHGRYSFNLRDVRMGQTLTEYNETRKELFEQSKKAAEEARKELPQPQSTTEQTPPPF